MIAQALDSIKDLADEIIVCVDNRSTDATKKIVSRYTKRVYDFTWQDNFSDARNFSLSKATGDWILVLDADEVIALEDYERIRELMKKDVVAYAFPQISYTNDTAQYHYTPLLKNNSLHVRYHSYWKNFSGYISCHIIRLFRNHRGIVFDGAVHESVDASCKDKGKVEQIPVWIHHYQFARGLEHLKEKQLQYLHIYEKNIATYPDQARAYRDMASIYYTYTPHYEKAREYFEKSLALNNKNKKTYVGLGLCYLKLGGIERARKIFEQALHLFPHDQQLRMLLEVTHEQQKDL